MRVRICVKVRVHAYGCIASVSVCVYGLIFVTERTSNLSNYFPIETLSVEPQRVQSAHYFTLLVFLNEPIQNTACNAFRVVEEVLGIGECH